MASSICTLDYILHLATRLVPESTENPVLAYVRIHPEDVQKVVNAGEVFTVRGFYNIGSPKVSDIPFVVSPRGFFGHTVPPGFRVLSVNPPKPNLKGITDPNIEQPVTVRAVVRGDIPPWEGDPDSERYWVYLDISTFQDDPDAMEQGVTRITGPDANVPNVEVKKVKNGYIVVYDLPEDEAGMKIPIDVRLKVYDVDGNIIADEVTYTDRVIENVGLFWDLINSILPVTDIWRDVTSGGPDEPRGDTQQYLIEMHLKAKGSIWNRDSVSLVINWPPFEEISSIPLLTEVNVGLLRVSDRYTAPEHGFDIWRIRAKQPYWVGDPEVQGSGFTNYWPQPQYKTTGTLTGRAPSRQVDPVTKQETTTAAGAAIQIDFQWRVSTDGGAWSEWHDISERSAHAMWPFEAYASTFEIIQFYPFGNARYNQIPPGTHVFEVRAIRTDGLEGASVYPVIYA